MFFLAFRKDWGAILLVDERFGRSPKYKNGLSKWVRGRCKTYTDFQNCLTSLATFAEARRLNPCPNSQGTPSTLGPQTPLAISNDSLMTPVTDLTLSCNDRRSTCTTVRPDQDVTPLARKDRSQTRDLTTELKTEMKDGYVGKRVGQLREISTRSTDSKNNQLPELVGFSSESKHRPMNQEMQVSNTGSVVFSKLAVGTVGQIKGSLEHQPTFEGQLGAPRDTVDKLVSHPPNLGDSKHEVKTEAKPEFDSTKSLERPGDQEAGSFRYSNFENLIKPILGFSGSQGRAAESYSKKPLSCGRAKLFKTATPNATGGLLKNAALNNTSLSIAKCSLVDDEFLGNDDFLESLTDREINEINTTAILDRVSLKETVKQETAVTASGARDNSPDLFSDSIAMNDDSFDWSEAVDEDGKEGWGKEANVASDKPNCDFEDNAEANKSFALASRKTDSLKRVVQDTTVNTRNAATGNFDNRPSLQGCSTPTRSSKRKSKKGSRFDDFSAVPVIEADSVDNRMGEGCPGESAINPTNTQRTKTSKRKDSNQIFRDSNWEESSKKCVVKNETDDHEILEFCPDENINNRSIVEIVKLKGRSKNSNLQSCSLLKDSSVKMEGTNEKDSHAMADDCPEESTSSLIKIDKAKRRKQSSRKRSNVRMASERNQNTDEAVLNGQDIDAEKCYVSVVFSLMLYLKRIVLPPGAVWPGWLSSDRHPGPTII